MLNLFNLPSCIAGIFGRMIPLQGVRLTQSLSQFHGVLAVRPIKRRLRSWPLGLCGTSLHGTDEKLHGAELGHHHLGNSALQKYYELLSNAMPFWIFWNLFFFWKDTISIVFEDTRYLYVTDFFFNGQIRFTQRLLCEQSQLRLKGHCYHQLQGQPRRSRPLSVFGGWLLEAERYRTSLFLKQIH